MCGEGFCVCAPDELGRVTEETKVIDTVASPVRRAYDLLGRVTSLTYPDAEVATSTYNRQGGIDTDTLGTATQRFTCDANGNVATKTKGAITRTVTCDAENRLARVTENPSVTVTLHFSPAWNVFSLPVVPATLAVSSVFPTFSTNFKQLSKFDAANQTVSHYVGLSEFDGFTNLAYGAGYQLDCKHPAGCAVTISGTRPGATNQPVLAGWNLLPAVSLTSAAAAEVFRDLTATNVRRYEPQTGLLTSTLDVPDLMAIGFGAEDEAEALLCYYSGGEGLFAFDDTWSAQ